MQSMVSINAVNRNDTVAQTVRCTFDVHVLEIMGTLIIGGTLINFRPHGILDLHYFATTLTRKQITCIQAVPSLLRGIFTYFTDTHQFARTIYLRSICCSGKIY